ncbi:hypothetical protein [Roseivirga sp. E12]|uniref:hypothetical protein n=1 Tax=Roseivirga sp. E12 TaxID=2819237 RepID=UPI001ABCAA69|nr:hypothetical protein [Roseivirga sp. E12]MBO3698066.1 hypothetical protein [Roseivirga sp. E12]
MQKNFKQSIRSGFFQFIMLVAGVLLALKANDWSEHQKNKKQTFQLLQKLEAEVEYTQARVDLMADFYGKLRDSVRINIPREYRKKGSTKFLNFWFGKEYPEFQQYVFELAVSTGKMNDLDLDLAMSLMRLRREEDVFSEQVESYDQDGWQEKNVLQRMEFAEHLSHDVFLAIDRIQPLIDTCSFLIKDRIANYR